MPTSPARASRSIPEHPGASRSLSLVRPVAVRGRATHPPLPFGVSGVSSMRQLSSMSLQHLKESPSIMKNHRASPSIHRESPGNLPGIFRFQSLKNLSRNPQESLKESSRILKSLKESHGIVYHLQIGNHFLTDA